MKSPSLLLHSALAIAALLSTVGPTQAQVYPSRLIKFILPFPAGSATDSIARVVGKDMSETLGQPVIIDNKPGAGGAIAAELVAKAAPDGYTLLVGTNTQLGANPSLYKSLPYDPVTSFSPVARLSSQPTALLVRKDFPAKTIAELVAYAKANPKKLSAGYGAASAQVAVARLRALTGIDVVEVPYKGIPAAVLDTISGNVDFTFGDLGTAIAQVKGGKVTPLGVTSVTRSPLTPEWPAVAETYPGFEVVGWHAIVAPAGTPVSVRMKLHDAAAKALAKPEVVQALAALGVTPAPMKPEELAVYIPVEIKRWAEMIKEAGITPE
jgi:tripartite-type tricarboxylate transporter receptor subunit TctC